MRYKRGDKIRVTNRHYGWEPYEVGDVYTVENVSYDETGAHNYDLISVAEKRAEDEYLMFASEVEPYEEPPKDFVLKIGDEVATSIKDGLEGRSSKAISSITPVDGGWAFAVEEGDNVEHPSHYTQGKFETIEIIEHTVSGYSDGFTAHCVGTATKYLNRAPFKHETPLEDLKKARQYLDFAIKHEEDK